ncbi:MAG: hypothetical protein LC126_19160 [Bryobacterales bacterium]|nr:hypothetical protein [Bryobacterales bacterium]
MKIMKMMNVVMNLMFIMAAQPQPQPKLVALSGDGGVNNTASRAAEGPVMVFQDEDGRPLKGAQVTFLLPQSSPGAVFAGGKRSVSVETDADGKAAAPELHPYGIGEFEIEVRAEYQKRAASMIIRQTNTSAAANYRIEILEGDDGVNVVDKKTAVKTVARVLDKNNLPVAGIPVVIAILATRGGRAEFPDGKSSVALVTDAEGKVVSDNLTPTGKGPLQLKIEARIPGQTITRNITQTNFKTELAALQAGKVPGSSTGDGVPEVSARATDGQAIEVSDATGPVAGAQVAFLLPSRDKYARFENGARYLIARTDASGRAAQPVLRQSGKSGVTVQALVAYHGRTSSLEVSPVRLSGSRGAAKAPGHRKTAGVAALAAVGASVAGGVLARQQQQQNSAKDCRSLCARFQNAYQSAVSGGACKTNVNLFQAAHAAGNEYYACVGEGPTPAAQWANVDLVICIGTPVSEATSCQR